MKETVKRTKIQPPRIKLKHFLQGKNVMLSALNEKLQRQEGKFMHRNGTRMTIAGGKKQQKSNGSSNNVML